VIGVEVTEQSHEDQVVVQLAPGTDVQPKSETLAAPVLEHLATEDVADIATEKSDTSFEQQIVIEYGRSAVQVTAVYLFISGFIFFTSWMACLFSKPRNVESRPLYRFG